MIDLGALYSVQVSDSDFMSLGTCLRFGDDMDWVGFHDTGRGHHIEGRLLTETEDGFVWQRQYWEGDQMVERDRLIFKLLTLEKFDKDYRPKVVGDLPQFNSTQDLHEWYRRQFGSRGCHY